MYELGIRIKDSMYKESWWIENHIRCTVFSGEVTSEDMFVIDKGLMEILDASPHPIHFVMDDRELKNLPPLQDGLKLKHLRHPRIGWVVVLLDGSHYALRFFLTVAFKA